MAGRFIDFLRGLTAKSTTIDGTEQVHIDSSGLSQKATLANIIRYGGGSPRSTTAGNATVTQTADGALYLEVAGQTAGNARGAGAFDWQASRTTAAQVASGTNSIAVGAGCTATGSYAKSTGQFCVVSAGWAQAHGYYLTANILGQSAWGISRYGLNCSQGSLVHAMEITTDATPVALNPNGIGGRITIPANHLLSFTGIVSAFCIVSGSPNTYFAKVWKIEGVITRDGNNTTRLVGTPTIIEIAKDADGTPTPSTWAIASITADDTNEALAINITGQAATTIRWAASLFCNQVGY